jgi:hypothetical protein
LRRHGPERGCAVHTNSHDARLSVGWGLWNGETAAHWLGVILIALKIAPLRRAGRCLREVYWGGLDRSADAPYTQIAMMHD